MLATTAGAGPKPKALLTGAASFTGYWIAQALAARGFEVTAPLRGAKASRDLDREARLAALDGRVEAIERAPTGSARLQELAEARPFDVAVLHGAEVGQFRRPGYNARAAVAENLMGLAELLAAMQARGLRHLIVTGSVFEHGEGWSTGPLVPIGAYGLAKTLTWRSQLQIAANLDLPITKVVIPSPFGAFGKPGLVRSALEAWAVGRPFRLQHPDQERDWVPAQPLGELYADIAMGSPPDGIAKLTPSLLPLRAEEFLRLLARRAAAHNRGHTFGACRIETGSPDSANEPRVRTGLDRMSVTEERLDAAFAGLLREAAPIPAE